MPTWSEYQMQVLRDRAAEGSTGLAIGKELGKSRVAVVAMAARNNIELGANRRPLKFYRNRFEAVIDLIADEDFPLDIAAQTVGVPLWAAKKLWAEICAQRSEQNI